MSPRSDPERPQPCFPSQLARRRGRPTGGRVRPIATGTARFHNRDGRAGCAWAHWNLHPAPARKMQGTACVVMEDGKPSQGAVYGHLRGLTTRPIRW